jgi:competence protein ComEC
MKLLKFPIVLFSLCLVAGIALNQWLDLVIDWVIYTFLGLLIVFFILYYVGRYRMNKTIWFGLTTMLLMISGGVLIHHFHQPILHKSHYIHHVKSDTSAKFLLEISDVLKPNIYNDRYYAKVITYDNEPVNGKLLLNISRDSLAKSLNVGEIIAVITKPENLPGVKNPHQFDYKAYLERQYVYVQINTKYSEILQTNQHVTSISYYAAKFRNHTIKQLEFYGLTGDELAVVKAMLLGQRQDLSEDIQNNFISAGAIHILAISGLHIGIILYLLNWLLKPFEYLQNGTYIKTIILILLLWSYAVVAGLSPSVVRAVTMFTAVAIAINLKRANNIYNTLAVSAFLLLLFKPNFLFEVGFQMSYTAVIGIVSIQPVLLKLLTPKFWIIKKIWEIFTVTIAAQASVLPISIYYFHQFPSLFFMSNLVIIPFLGVILGFGFFIIIFASLGLMYSWIVKLYSYIINGLNLFIEWIAGYESFLIKDIPLSVLELVTLFFLIATLVSLIEKQTAKRLIWVLTSIVIFQLAHLFTLKSTEDTTMIVFHKTAESMIGIKTGRQLLLYSNTDSLDTNQNLLRNYKVGNRIKSIETATLGNVLQYENKLILVVDSLGIYNVNFKPDVVILRDSPKINLTRLINELCPPQLVADGSNYASYVERWQATCDQKEIPFHSTRQTGFYIIDK